MLDCHWTLASANEAGPDRSPARVKVMAVPCGKTLSPLGAVMVTVGGVSTTCTVMDAELGPPLVSVAKAVRVMRADGEWLAGDTDGR